jgi:mannose-6-phosphate isomerase-like protein (cupin superfamily)
MELKNRIKEQRPWGNFEQFTKNEKTTVKIITANPNQELSLQTHEKREEFWHIISGNGTVVLDDKKIEANPSDDFFIGKNTKHRMIGGKEGIKWIEISFGEFDENDIVRIEDKYNRI